PFASTSSQFGSSIFGNTQSSPLFSSTTPTNPQSGSTFGQNTSPFGQTGAFSQPSLFNPPSSGLAGSIFSSSASLTSNALTGFGQTTPSMSTPFQTAQPAQSSGTFAISNFGQTQPGTQTPTQAFANTAIGQSEFGGQRGGSRVASYSATFIEDTPSIRAETQTPTQPFANTAIEHSEFRGRLGGSRVASYSSTFVEDTPSTQTEKLESISAIPFYKGKSHEELRWDYYELGNKDFGTSAETIFTSESILATPVYKDKSHEELRWEDYQLGDKGGGSSFGGTPGMFDRATPPNSIVAQPALINTNPPQNSIVAQPAPINTNPFGTLPALPQMSIGRVGSTPSVQYGISSMPVQDKPAPIRISSVLTARHLLQKRIKYPLRKYKNEESR
ncbi:nucleoporin autopeptidase, partial [Trifolium pratense]